MASTKGGSYAMPVVFRAHLIGLTPNQAYKYVTRGIVSSDFSSTAQFPGAGTSMFLDSGNWKYATTPSWTSGSSHDTFYTNGAGEYEGWFGFIPTSDSRFNPGKNVYPCILAKGITATDSLRVYGFDSMHVMAFGAGKHNDSCTGIWGKSLASSKSFVALYDNVNGTGRPLSLTMIEKDEITVPGAVSFYSNVEGVAGNWACIIPNNNAAGVQRIEKIDRYNGIPLYANQDADGKWGASNKNTINPSGGRTSPVALDENDAALVSPVIEFLNRTSTTTEGAGVKEIYVVRKYSNNQAQSVRISLVGGTAAKGASADFNLTEPRTITFNPGGLAYDTTKITIVDDNMAETDETVVLRLDQPTNCVLGVEVANTLTITDNDVATVTFGVTKLTAKETDGTVSIKVKMDKAISSPSSIRLGVKSKGDSSLIPSEFKLGKSFTDSVFNLGKTTGPDSITIKAIIVDDLNKDWDDTFVMNVRVKSGIAKIGKDSLNTIIVKDNDGPAYIKFVGTSVNVSEKVGSVKIKIKVISKTDAGGDFTLRWISAASTASQGSDFTFNPTSQIINIDNSTPDTISVSIPILDDQVFENLEKAVFGLGVLSNIVIQKPDTFTINISSDDYPLYSPTLISKQNKAGRVADSLNVKCRVTGTVHGGNMRSGGLQFTIMDKTAGLGVLSSSKTFGYTVAEGDSVMVQGTVTQVQGMVTMDQLDTIVVIAKNRTLRTPNIANDVDETTESKMTKFTRVILVNSSDWPTSALSPNTNKIVRVKHTDGSIDSLIIDAETNIDGTSAPTGYINVTGIGSQYDPTAPLTNLYGLNPRYLADIEAASLPVVNFKKVRDTIFETADSLSNIGFKVLPLDENFTFDVVVKTSSTTAVSPTDYNFNTRTITVIKNNSVNSIKCNISDDNVSDGDKILVLAIRNIVGPGSLGPDSLLTVLIKDDEPSNVMKFTQGQIKMYPNPASGKVFISSVNALSQVQIIAMDGRVVYTGGAGNSFEIPLATAAGVYQVKITSATGEMYSEALMIK